MTSLSRTLRRRCYLLNKAKFAMTIAILIRTTAASARLPPGHVPLPSSTSGASPGAAGAGAAAGAP